MSSTCERYVKPRLPKSASGPDEGFMSRDPPVILMGSAAAVPLVRQATKPAITNEGTYLMHEKHCHFHARLCILTVCGRGGAAPVPSRRIRARRGNFPPPHAHDRRP